MSIDKFCVLLCWLSLFISVGKTKFTSFVQTHNGVVRGEILRTIEKSLPYAAFKGIPYAESPVKKLRFQPPVEKRPWKKVLDATKGGSMCIQYNSTSSTVVGSEDCLYLNVFTPHTQFRRSLAKPVMIWIHGGAFKTGNSNASYYGPDFLLQEDVVVVSMNYRLGALGFLNLNHEKASGNYGLKDQNLVLKWVQKNIANFGGDPKQVTIMGQSAGSISVDLHVLSEMSSGLFNQSISMSGSTLCLYWGIQPIADAESTAFTLGSKFSNETLSKDELVEILLQASAHDIVNKSNELMLIPFRPTIESTSVAKSQEKFLTECSVKKYAFGNYNKGPHLMGFTSAETVAFGARVGNLMDLVNAGLESVKTAALSIDLSFLISIVNSGASGISSLTGAATNRLIQQTTNLFFVTGIDMKQQLLYVHNNHPIYYYRYTFDSPFSAHRSDGINLEGAAHEDELPHIFYRPHLRLPLNEPRIKATRQRLTRLWTNFAKYSNPTPPQNSSVLDLEWPASGFLGQHLEIGEDLVVRLLRPSDTSVKAFQLAGLGNSPILNDCTIIPSITDILGGITNNVPIIG